MIQKEDRNFKRHIMMKKESIKQYKKRIICGQSSISHFRKQSIRKILNYNWYIKKQRHNKNPKTKVTYQKAKCQVNQEKQIEYEKKKLPRRFSIIIRI